MSLATGWERFFHGPQAAVRPYLLARILPALLALDTWMLMIGHAGRYGAAGFNVAHFAWLDRVQPLPTPTSYIGLLILTGLLALYAAIAGLGRWTAPALCLLYTLSWSSSMLDSYQHHYFLSLVLVCLLAFPRVSADDLLEGGQDARSNGFGYPLLSATVAILYAYAALAKCDEQWLDGHTIRRISQAGQLLAPVLERAEAAGVASETLWSWLSTAVIPMELALGVGYLFASQQDRVCSTPMRVACGLTALLALALHAGAEAMSLDIGWFSYYMMVLAAVYLLPASWLAFVGKLWIAPAHRLRVLTADVAAELDREANGRLLAFLVAIAAAGITWYAGRQVNLPGATIASTLFGGCVIAHALARIARGEHPGASVRPALAAVVASLLMWTAIAQSEVRWDFYRYLGGDLARRGELEDALETYLIGEAYAPPGQTRGPKIQQLKRQLGR